MEERINFKNAGGLLAFLVFACMICWSNDTVAQNRFSVQFRPGVSFATTDIGDANIESGFGFEFEGAYCFMRHVSAYAGWGWSRFGNDQSFCWLS